MIYKIQIRISWRVCWGPLDHDGFLPSSPSAFRMRLVEHQKERYVFDPQLKVSREAGMKPLSSSPWSRPRFAQPGMANAKILGEDLATGANG